MVFKKNENFKGFTFLNNNNFLNIFTVKHVEYNIYMQIIF